MNIRILFCLFSCLLISFLSAQNLIPNGDFEQGAGIGFQSDYNLINPGAGQANSVSRQYAIINDPYLLNTSNFINSGDYTTGTGLMMVCDGAHNQSEVFWKTNGDILLEAGETYRFRFFIRSVNNTNPQPEIGFRVMAAAATYFTGSYTVTEPSTGWQEVSFDYTVSEPGAPYRRFELYNINQSDVGNDFAIDEIILERLEPLTINYSSINVSCFGENDGSIVVYGQGGTQPYTSYSITGPVNLTNTTGIFINLPPGTYTASVTDSNADTATASGIVIIQPNDLVVTPNRTICLGESATLTASGGANYVWTAVPADPSLTDPNNASVIVSPTTTTTYTVNSTSVTPRNLIFNGDFSLGNTGFTTDYQYLDPVNPVGVQGAYAVVTNSQTWFAGFSNCTDHTSGTGNMMVVDGSIANSGNDKVWCQTVPVTPGQNYTFSYWIQTVATPNPANIDVIINGVSIGSNLAPTTTCGWVQRSYTWNSGVATTAEICMFDRVVTVAGNDFAIDDIQFVTNSTCNLSKSVTVTVQSISATASFTSGDVTSCPGSTLLTFSGTPNTSFTISSSSGGFYNIPINAAGTASFTTPFLNTTTIFTLVSIFQNPPGCSAPLTGSVTITINLNGCATVTAGGVDLGDAISAQACDVNECIDLTASYIDFGTTTQYTVSEIDFCPQAPFINSGAPWNELYGNPPPPGGVNGDDQWSAPFAFPNPNPADPPFVFCFFGNQYTSINVGTNGVITFNPQAGGSNCPWAYNQTIPNAGFPIRNAIYGVYQDTDFSVTPTPPAQISATYAVVGTYPCRKFIANFSNMPQFSCANSVGLQTSQIVLYEISNIVEVYVQRRTPCPTWNNGNGLIGIQNAAGTLAYTPPGFNTGAWSATNRAFRFTPSGPSSTTFQWLENGNPYSTDTTITVCPTVTSVYTAQATYTQCSGVTSVEKDFTINVFLPEAGTDPIDLEECENLFDLTVNDAVMVGSGDPFLFSIGYYTSQSDAEQLLDQITTQNAFVATSNPQTIYAAVSDFSTGCDRIRPFTIQWDPCGLDPQANPLALCDDASGDGFEIFDLTQNDLAALNGLQASLHNITYHTSQADADIGVAAIIPANIYNGTTQTIYVRVEEIANPTTNFGTTFFSLTVHPPVIVTVNDPTVCEGDDATVTATPGVAGSYDYAWTVPSPASNPGNVASFTTTIPGVYSVIITDLTTGCQSVSTSGIVTVNPNPTATVNSPTVCEGTSATLTATPGVAGSYDYVWSVPSGPNPGNVASFTTAIAGVYSVIITDTVTGCFSASASGTVTIDPNPTVTVNSPSVCDGAATTVIATPGTAGTYDYVWTIPSGSNPGNVASFTTTIPGVYSVIITDTVTGCFSASASGTVTSNPNPTVTVNSPTECEGTPATVTATPSGASTYDYVWTVPSGTNPGNVASFTTTIAGVYSVIITDTVTGCFSASASGTVTINLNPTVTVNSPSVCDGTSATVTATPGVAGSYDYVWSVPSGPNPGNVASFTTAIAGVYSVIITDTVTGCFSASASGTVTINPNPTVTVNSPSVCDGAATTVIATPGTAGTYDYVWTIPSGTNPGNVASFTTTIPGVYSVIITDTVTGCFSASASGTVTSNPNPTVIVNSPTECEGTPATVTATPGVAGSYDYTWSVPSGPNPGNVASFTTTIAGVYSVIITDTVTGCFSASASGTVTINLNPTVSVNSPSVCDGTSATVTATPGVAGSYDYVWTVPSGPNPGNVASFTTAIAGVYSVIITDTVTGCFSASASGTVTINPNPTVTVNSPSVCDGAATTVIATPGTAGTYDYVWTIPSGTNPGNVASFTTTIPGVYSVIITDTVTGCFSASASGTVTSNPNPTVIVNSPTECEGTPATVTATPGVAGSYDYTWSVPSGPNPGNVASFTTTIAGVYSVIITDTVTGCFSASASGTVTINLNPTVSVNSPSVCDGTSATVTATPGVAGSYDYVWTVPSGPNPGNVASFTTAIAGVYSVIITDTVTGCFSASASGTVTINPNPTVTVNSPSVCDGTAATVIATPAIAGSYNYAWTIPSGSNPGNVASFTTTIAGVYSVIITDTVTGCFSASASGTVTINPNPTVTVNSPTVCAGDLATLTATPSTPGTYDYVWTVPTDATNPGNVASFNTAVEGVYSVVITDTTTGCFSTSGSGTVTLLPLPTASVSGDIIICPTGEATITFTATPGSTIEYTINTGGVQTQVIDASGIYTITDTYTITTTYTLIGVFTNTIRVCSVPLNQTATVTVAPAPLIFTHPDLVLCDDNNDGRGLFNLAQTENIITGGATGLTVTYHETLTDAQLGGAPILSPANYLSLNPWLQTIYVRVINTGATDCPSITTFNLIVNPFPVINTTPDDYALCDDDTDGVQVFDLSSRLTNILGGLDPSLHTVTFHPSQAEAIVGTPQLPPSYSSSTQTIWVRVTINATGCYDVAPLELVVNPLPIANLPTPLTLCDDNNPGDEEEEFDLTQAIAEIVGTQQGLVVTFHFTLLQAQQGTNALPTLYTNTSNVQTIHVRVLNPVTGCYSTTTLDLRVEPLPILLIPINPITLCDDNNDGLATFDLGALIPDLLNGATDITVTFHETEQEALDGNNDLPLSYLTILPWQQFIYVRAEHNTTGCVRVMMLELVVNPSPEVPTNLPDIVQCDTDGNQQNGFSTFDLSVQTPIILAAQSGAASDYQVAYFTSQADAIGGTSAIANITTYQNTSNPQTIWVRVTDIATGCFHTGSFNLIVNLPLALTIPDPISLCDEALPNNQFTVFDLTIRNNAITNNLGGYTVTYYPSYQNALDNVNAIQDPTAYTNAVAAVQTLGVKVTSAAGCSSFTTLTIRVIPRPEPLFDPAPIEECDDNNPGDGLENFDLTQRAIYILNGASLTEFSLTYFESYADAETETNPIPVPTSYDSTNPNTQTIYVRVTRIPTNPMEPRCYEIVELQLIVNPLPDIVSPVNLYQCVAIDQPILPFTLSLANEDVLGANQTEADFSVTYYASQAHADAGSPQLPNTYPSTSVQGTPETIYVRVENKITACFIVGTVDLVIEEGTFANPIPVDDPAVTKCDDQDADNDGLAAFNLDADVTPLLLGATITPPNNYAGTVVYYFESLTAAQQAAEENDYSGALSGTDLTAFVNTTPFSQEIYAVLVNPNTQSGCPNIVPVTLTVHKIPEPTVQDDFICTDPITGDVIREAILESGLDPLTHNFVWTDSLGNELGTDANLTVNTPGAYTLTVTNNETEPKCSNTITVNVVQSEQATLSYVQSNYFTDNATITIIANGITIPDQGNANYVYSLDNGPFQTSNVFTNVSAGSHLVTVRDLNGCEDATIEVFVVDYPKFFTPNGDGYNDTWNIFSLRDTNPNAKIYIFDRYGKFLKQIVPIGQGWDGTFNGENLPSTDYWFTVEYLENDQTKTFKAHFSLKR
ncbi:T9SS type B sorting domain-containing protein [Flavobacterium azooxidireducens]|uniref:T9SS type B sorting domain-containing protein n=1 Tax=Flavobacterium azooxidireducens TaxID=1871076 RepID=A0ABY4KGI1_9FLAO|nr:T9SS type B sorting domain-containing protein [Flavobacterium azooxidireducens]UPQ78562.1 T9SS type B sorting domain-containing protein [Flavobacterium azooxidireducens]